MEGFVPIKGFENTHLINKETQQIYSTLKKRILKGHIQNGYLLFDLKDKDGKVRLKKFHRLMAETFIPNPNNYPVINHKDGNKLNNNIDNLEWCTISHNNKEAYRLGLRKVSDKTREKFKRNCLKPENIANAVENLKKSKEKAIKNAREVNIKPVCIFKDGFYKEFNSEVEACKYLNVYKGGVGRVANGKIKTVKGYYANYLKKEKEA